LGFFSTLLGSLEEPHQRKAREDLLCFHFTDYQEIRGSVRASGSKLCYSSTRGTHEAVLKDAVKGVFFELESRDIYLAINVCFQRLCDDARSCTSTTPDGTRGLVRYFQKSLPERTPESKNVSIIVPYIGRGGPSTIYGTAISDMALDSVTL
jgi:hypothetical protein